MHTPPSLGKIGFNWKGGGAADVGFILGWQRRDIFRQASNHPH